MSSDNPKIAPFGKYKGQPLEALAQDRSYLDWLATQDWFRERYANIYTMIVNNFAEPTETPDHNALQVLFLEDDFCTKFISVLYPDWYDQAAVSVAKGIGEYDAKIRDHLKDVETWTWDNERQETETKKTKAHLAAFEEWVKTIELSIRFSRTFEHKGVDVYLTCFVLPKPDKRAPADCMQHGFYGAHSIEIKPTVGDDYPAILRQMRPNESNVLFTERYTGVGATEKQFVETFALSHIKVVFRHDVDAAQAELLTGAGTLNKQE